MTRATLLDFGMGNLRSVARALERAGAEVSVSETLDDDAELLVVPGQGAFGSCLTSLGSRLEEIGDWITAGRRYLGICLGLQILYEASEEDPHGEGLGLFAGKVLRLPDRVKIPHIGWNEVASTSGDGSFAGIEAATRFYFVHSYAAEISPETVATSEHGVVFTAAAARGNVFASQFHPEKSGDVGHTLLRNVIAR